jgi:hypothetical protein
MVVGPIIVPKITLFSSKPRKNGSRVYSTFIATATQGSQPHYAVKPSAPAILPTLPFAISTTDIPKHPCPSSNLLPILPLRNHQPSSTFTSSTNNLSPIVLQITYPIQNNTNTNANQVKIEPNPPLPPPPPPQQVQEHPQQPENPKRQRRDYYCQVNHAVVEGPISQTKWS